MVVGLLNGVSNSKAGQLGTMGRSRKILDAAVPDWPDKSS